MQHTAQQLRAVVATFAPQLLALGASERTVKPHPEKWSKVEILGHLLDSAANNHQKFIRTMAQEHTNFDGYAQNFWVSAQRYNEADWGNTVTLWQSYNVHLAHLIERTPTETLSHTISIDGSAPFTLEFIMSDYVEHLKHHLKQIFPDADLTTAFENVYGA